MKKEVQFHVIGYKIVVFYIYYSEGNVFFKVLG